MSDDKRKTIYIVMGTTGEYSDRNEWLVRAYFSKIKAEALVETLEAWCRENSVSRLDDRVSFERRDGIKCPLDPQFQCDYTGTSYYLAECEMGEA
jgi:hypothetical protein